MNYFKLLILSVLFVPVFALSASAEFDMSDDMTEEGVEEMPQEVTQEVLMQAFLSSLNFQKGSVLLGDDLVTLNLPDAYSYLSPEDADKVLVDVWGNPPGNETLGMIVPDDTSIFDMNSWAVIISYEEDGYVSDEDAEKIDYDELFQQMRESSEENNKKRVEAGYEPVDFVGWASVPYYDKEAKKLHWAKEIRFGDSDINTLNYNIRILGRKGVLVLNIVSVMPQFQAISNEIPRLLGMTEFNPGNTYADFDPKLDKVAAYGIGALVAGKLASKVGILAKFSGVLLALKKLWILIIVGIGAFFKALFGKKKTVPAQKED